MIAKPEPRQAPIIFIHSNEAQEERNEVLMHHLRKHFGSDRIVVTGALPVDFGFYVKDEQRLGERKIVPDDFLASVSDGRLKAQAAILAANRGFLLLEGKFRYNSDGQVVSGSRVRNYNIFQVTGLLMTIEEAGIKVLWSDGPAQTPLVLHEAYSWFSRGGSSSFMEARPRPVSELGWGTPTTREKILWAFQGLGIGPKTARQAWEKAGTLRKFIEMSAEERKAIPGMGPVRSRKVDEILDEEWRP